MRAYGYSIRGLPALLDDAGDDVGPLGVVDVHLRQGPVADTPPSWLVEGEASMTLGWAGEAEYQVRSRPSPAIECTLAGIGELEGAFGCCLSVLPLALPILGLEPLHGSAVRTPSGALLMLGRSGAGKSTLAAALVARGYGLVADDACAIDREGRLWPGPPVVRLHAPADAALPGAVLGTYDGKAVVRAPGVDPAPLVPTNIALLDPGPDRALAVRPLDGRAAFAGVMAQVRSPAVLQDQRAADQLARVALVTTTAHVAAVSYDHRRHPPELAADAVVEWLEAPPARPAGSVA